MTTYYYCIITLIILVKVLKGELLEDLSQSEDYTSNESGIRTTKSTITVETFSVNKQNRFESIETKQNLDSFVSNYTENSISNGSSSCESISRATEDSTTEIVDKQNSVGSGIHNSPYSVSIQRKNAHYTSGALLHKNWVLSVAAEFYFNTQESMKLFRARLGSNNCKKGGISMPLKRIEIHPSFIYGRPSYDVSLLRLVGSVKFNELIRPISISTSNAEIVEGKFLISYWPRIIVNGSLIPQTALEHDRFSMRMSKQKLIPWQKCLKFMRSAGNELNWPLLCLKPMVTRHIPCLPDAGAPVVGDDGMLWGVTSGWISEKCKIVHSPTVFTRISLPDVRIWIDSLLDQ